ncbi:EF-P beta-lysylation protein EpmB [Methylomonas sp. UP202]|uniref:EF-P beta-lysylation protein EpmB n=1 Tax=Methylomonas sp. UP202 TaxID=3040943 RepID=UPI00247AB92F|nr:EF-P beta-lysylation protein EpmB [Methylomonas sp. UP202]WGS84928.1 EF-P beta-lysylation protein EpmB [Methylomonas sp. UP202]
MTPKTARWQRSLADAFDSVDALLTYLELTPDELPILRDYPAFPLKVPRGFAARMEPRNPNDPLLRQVLPLGAELHAYPGYSRDPVGDLHAIAAPGVIHKYAGRVLLVATGGCAVHCRYCFRRNFPYAEQQLSRSKLALALDYIAERPDIHEVILSGGDPLLLSDDKLFNLLTALAGIGHIRRLRIHSRIPIVLPERMTDTLLDYLSGLPVSIVLVVHANHANELSSDVGAILNRWRRRGITLLNQSVLLAGINDNVDALCNLSEKLFGFGILPYYLHLLDKAAGVGHFEVAEDTAKQLLQRMQRTLPGYLVPKLVKECAGEPNKTSIL